MTTPIPPHDAPHNLGPARTRAADQARTGDQARPRPRGIPRSVVTEHDEQLCRTRDVLGRVGDKWSMSVVYELGKGSRRFTEIKRAMPGVSQRMLTATLRGLERDGLLTRTVYPVVPPRVDYELTPLGQTLLEAAWPLMTWVVEHTDEVETARLEYDAQ